jgi:hypothetical protein
MVGMTRLVSTYRRSRLDHFLDLNLYLLLHTCSVLTRFLYTEKQHRMMNEAEGP